MKSQSKMCAVAILLAFRVCVLGQSVNAKPPELSPDGFWQSADTSPAGNDQSHPWLQPGKFRAFRLDPAALRNTLARAPREFTTGTKGTEAVISLPMPDGSFARFRIVKSPIMEPELAAKFPEIKTYAGQGIDDPTASVRCDVTPAGFRAQVLSADGPVFIEPFGKEAPDIHASFRARDAAWVGWRFDCKSENSTVQPEKAAAPIREENGPVPNSRTAGDLRVYRLAMAADGEYTTLNGGRAGAMAEIVSAINRANGYFESELAVRLVLIANNDLLIYTDPATDPFPPVEPCVLKNTNQIVLDAVIGAANYDIGHIISGRTAGGCAGGPGLDGVVCQNGQKAKGTSPWPFPPGYGSPVGGLIHEMGHQLGANHTWNGAGEGCTLDQYASIAAYEPGSGSTIMSYSGICGSGDNLQPWPDLYYHSGSLNQINNYVNGVGASCRVLQPTGNAPPAVNAGQNYTIPARTPFVLTATGSDPDGDRLTYCWEQRDLGPRQPATGPGSADNGSSPLFRSFLPTTNASRIFPKLSDILNNTTTIGEQLPSRNRTLHFRVTARDGRTGITGADMQVAVVSNVGPFRVIAPNSALVWSGSQTVLWDLAGTTNTPISATNVNILLSTNGGYDFPITLAANTPNDGSQDIALPEVYAPLARIKVEAVGNIFFDISRTNFIIVPHAPVVRAVAATLVTETFAPTNGVIDPGETVTIQFSLENIGAGAASNLIVSVLPTGGVLVPGSAQANGFLPGGGARITNSFSFTADPALTCGTTLTATLHVLDGAADLGTVAFPLHLGTATLNSVTLANNKAILVPLFEMIGTNYPSTIVVSNLSGVIGHLTVTLSNVTHSFPGDIRALLVGPGGQSVLILSDTLFSAIANVTLTLDDLAPASLLQVTQVVSGSYQPSDVESPLADIFPLPAPPLPYAKKLSAFNGTNPNGVWRLFVADSVTPLDAGGFNSGWALNITTSNAVCCSSIGLTLSMADSPDQVIAGTPLSYILRVTNISGAVASGVIVTNPLLPGVTFVSAMASQGFCTNTGGALVCDLGTLSANAEATVTLEVIPHVAGTLINTASVTRDGAGANPSGNTASVLTTVAPPIATVSINDVTVTEGDSGTLPAVFAVNLSVSNLHTVTVAFTTTNNSATAGNDYVATNGTLTFLPGETAKTLTVVVNSDLLDETNETFFVRLSDPANPALYIQARGTIIDNDPPPSVFINDISVVEGNAGTTVATFTIGLSAASGLPVSMRAVTANGSATAADYVTTNVVVFFPIGTSNQLLSILAKGDTLTEINETFLVNLSSLTNANFADAQGVATILDDDFKVTAAEISGSDVRLRFTTIAGRSYRVERADDLAAPVVWSSVAGADTVAGTGGIVEALDLGAVNQIRRFYRAVLLP